MAESAVVYATRAELTKYSVPANAIASISTTDQDDALRAASRIADSYLIKQFQLPLSQAGEDLVQAVCDIAAYRLLKRRGFGPNSADAEQYRLSHEDAIRWLTKVSKGEVTPVDIIDASSSTVGDTDSAGEATQTTRHFAYQYRQQTDADTSGFFQNSEDTATDFGVLPGSSRRGW